MSYLRVKPSNKKSGTDFENRFRKMLREHGYWSHKLVENENGAPFDILALKEGRAYAFDCKECGTERFRLSRIEDNQVTGMTAFEEAGGKAYFILRCDDDIRIASGSALIRLAREGVSSIKITEWPVLEGWWLWH